MIKKIIVILLVIFGSSVLMNAQVYEIENGTVTACGGVFYDDNGGVDDAEGVIGNDYSASSYTYTICPETAGDGIQVSFVGFSVSQNINPDNSDVLLIYNGDSASGTPMGNSNSLNFSGITFSATADNPTGCLTFVFIHNDLNPLTGGWQANLECITPCSTPIAAGSIVSPVPDGNNAIQACLGQVISFADIGSTPAPGFTLENYIWNFGDGETSIGPANIEHEYDVPGEYIATLVVEDNNGCQSTNVTPYQILVSTIPIFNTDFSEEVCLGGDGYLDGNPVQGVTWTSLPPQVVSGVTFLADGVGFEFNSSLDFNFFEDDQVLESCDDLYSIDVNMEHSYIGDLDITITCPDGTEVILLDYPNGGGGGYLGEPIDIGGDFTPGVGYDYAWTPDASNGTFGDNAIGGAPLPPGNYETTGDLCDLEGCPLNGQWTMTIVDNLGADDGNIFEWGISLNPELFPGVTTFTPEVGLSADSTFITGNFITFTSDDANYVEFTPPALGSYEYEFTAINTFGCVTDTIVNIEVVSGPVIDAGLDLLICNDPLDMSSQVVSNDFEPEPCEFTFVLSNNNGLGFNSSEVIVSFDGVVDQTLTAFGVSESFDIAVPSGSELTLEYVFSTWGEGGGNVVTVLDDSGEVVFESDESPSEGIIFQDAVICTGSAQLQYEWSPAEGLSNPFSPNPTVDVSQTTEFTLSVFPMEFEGCVTTDIVTVSVDPAGDPGSDSTLVLCYNYGLFDLIDMLGGNPVVTGEWTDGNGNVVDGAFNSITDDSDTFTYTVTNAGCVNIAQVDITVIPQGDPICCEFDYTSNITDALCNASSDGTYSITMNSSTEGGPWIITLLDGLTPTVQIADNQTIFTGLSAGSYEIGIEDAGLCITNFTIDILEPPVIGFEAVMDTTICIGGTASLDSWSATDINNNYIYTWIDLGTGSQFVQPVSDQVYQVFATTADGCLSPIEDVAVSVYDPLSFTVSNDTLICQESSIVLETDNLNGGFGWINFSWTVNGNQFSNLDEISISPSSTSEYCVTYADGCESASITECILVEVEETPTISLFSSTTFGCVPQEVVFENQSNVDDYVNSLWDVGDASYTGSSSLEHTYEVPGLYDVSLTLESALGCFYAQTFNNYMQVYPSPNPEFSHDPFVTTIPDTQIEFINLTEGIIVEQTWVFDTLNVLGTSTEVNPTFEFPITQGGAYAVSLHVVDFNGCEANQTNIVDINDPLNVFVPTAFTPNADGINDVLYIKGTDIDESRFKIKVFNRWGETVFESFNLNTPWNGSHMNGDYYVEAGVYNYVIETYSRSTTKRIEIQGHLTVVR